MEGVAEGRILEAAKARESETIDLLAQLVRIPSLTGEEGRAQMFIAEQLRFLGFEVETWEPNVQELLDRYPNVAQYPSHWQHDLILPYHTLPSWDHLVRSGAIDVLNYRGRPNVVGRLRGTGYGRSLLLNGHIDVVTVEPRGEWLHDPFGAAINDGRLYGRGAVDMKAGLVAGLAAMRALLDAGVTLKGDLIFESVVNEEHSGNGTLACVARGITADAAIVLEPSDGVISVGTAGAVYWGVLIRGRQVGTSARWDGDVQIGMSAIEKLPPVIEALLALESQLNTKAPHPLDRKRRPFSLTMGTVRGGTYDTATAAECLLKGSVYFSPVCGTVEDIMGLIRSAVREQANSDPWLSSHPPEVHFYHHDDSSETASTAPIVTIVGEAASAITGMPASVRRSGGACDMRHLVNQAKIPTVVFGPGPGQQAHKADEYVDLAQLTSCVQTLALAIYRWCGA